jgi:hypothetical protein
MLTFGNRTVRRLQVGLPPLAHRHRQDVRGVPAADCFQARIGSRGVWTFTISRTYSGAQTRCHTNIKGLQF